MQNKQQDQEGSCEPKDFCLKKNRISFTLMGSNIDIEFVGEADGRSRENTKAMIMDAFSERVKKWQ